MATKQMKNYGGMLSFEINGTSMLPSPSCENLIFVSSLLPLVMLIP
ncbi:MAG: hypothetical protein IPL46_21050 [Saprospiraceae bacterium]|nr:hypothetical protein [Saprospiraceae bacterium]